MSDNKVSYTPPPGPPPVDRGSYPGQQYHNQHHQGGGYPGQHQGGRPSYGDPPPPYVKPLVLNRMLTWNVTTLDLNTTNIILPKVRIITFRSLRVAKYQIGPPPMPPSQQQNYGPHFEGPNHRDQQPFFQYSQCNGKKKALCVRTSLGKLRTAFNRGTDRDQLRRYELGTARLYQ